jgi:hypothetical protein
MVIIRRNLDKQEFVMALGDFNENNREFLNGKFSELESDIGSSIAKTKLAMNTSFSQVQSSLEASNKLILNRLQLDLEASNKLVLKRLQQLKTADGPILDAEGLKGVFNGYKEELNKQQEALVDTLGDFKKAAEKNEKKNAEIIGNFKKAAEEYERKKKELLEREIVISQREAVAVAGFTQNHQREMAPYQELKKALEQKQAYLNELHEELVSYFKEGEKNQSEHLKKICGQLQADFEEKQRKLLEKESELEQLRNGLNDREEVLNQREAKIDGGLAEKREQDLYEYQDKMSEARKFMESNAQRDGELAKKESELHEREQNVQKAEEKADNGFAEKQREREAAFSQTREDIEKQYNEQHDKAFKDMHQEMMNYREQQRQTIRDEINKERDDFSAKIAEKETELRDKENSLGYLNSNLKAKEKELENREEEVHKMDARLKTLIALEEERQQVIGDQIQKVAREQLALKIEEKERLEKELVDLQLKYNELVKINSKFGDKSSDEIYRKINDLESKNHLLTLENDNLRHAR